MGVVFSLSFRINSYDEPRVPRARRERSSAHKQHRRTRDHLHDTLEKQLSLKIRSMQERIRTERMAAAKKDAIEKRELRKIGDSRRQHLLGDKPAKKVSKGVKEAGGGQEAPKSQQQDARDVVQSKKSEDALSLSEVSMSRLDGMDLTDLPPSLLEHPDGPDLAYTAEEEELLKDVMERAEARDSLARDCKVSERCVIGGRDVIKD